MKDVKTPWNPSRKALARVKDPLPKPCICHLCSGDVRIVGNEEIYGRQFGKWPWAFRCDSCRAYVGMHPYTDIPLGTLANEAMRNARKLAKAPFELLWGSGGPMSRDEAYAWLASAMGKEPGQCHFGWFDIGECQLAQGLCEAKANQGAAL